MKNLEFLEILDINLMKNQPYQFMEDRMIIIPLVETRLIKLILQNFLTIWNLH